MRVLLAILLVLVFWWLLTDDDDPPPITEPFPEPDRVETRRAARADPKSADRVPRPKLRRWLPRTSRRMKRAVKRFCGAVKGKIASTSRRTKK